MSSSYSFLDVAVLDAVRQRFAAGDALVVLSPDLAQVLWANGPGAALFGYHDIEAIIEAEDVLPPVARRQLMATAGFPDIGAGRSVTLRLTSGMSSRIVALLAGTIAMPDGESAILLAAATAEADSAKPAAIAAHALRGFTDGGEFLAFVDGDGGIEAASEGFAALGFSAETLAGLVAEVGGDGDRLVKRRVRIGTRTYPAGVARLTDDPVRHLLVVIDEGQAEEPETQAVPDNQPVRDGARGNAEDAAGVSQDAAATGGTTPETPGADVPHQHDHWYFAGEEDVARVPPVQAGSAVEPRSPAAEKRSTEQPVQSVQIDRNAAPVRFVWRTDADGAFSAISPEFATLVGKPAADVIGRRFKDVAASFGLDPTGEIAQLLERRDTWSGRTVRWPSVGLRIPVDLAALPVYNRNREFEGFRGFGVARPADAMSDPDAAEPSGQQAPDHVAGDLAASDAEPAAEAPAQADPFKGEVPALSIEPKPDRRFTDKVIRLAEHRLPANDKGLSSVERSAFREIGERLKKDSSTDQDDAGSVQPTTGGEAPQAGPRGNNGAAGTAEPAVAEAGSAASDAPNAAEPAAEARPGTVPLGPATAPGWINSADPAGETAAASEDIPQDSGASSDAVAELEDAAGLASLDGTAPADPDTSDAVRTARPRSLLDYADRAEPEDSTGEAGTRPAASDDDMAAADFADARDDETLPTGDEPGPTGDKPDGDEGAAESRPADSAVPEKPGDNAEDGARQPGASDARPRLPVPPLRSSGVTPSAFALPGEPDTSILAKLPVPLLIHSGDTLHYANDEFLGLTGFDALDDLATAGGLDALFADPYADSAADQSDRALRLRTRDGGEFPVDALLRAVPWRGGKALMLVLRRTGEDSQARQVPTPHAPGMAGDMVQPDIADLKARIAEMRTIIDTATDGVVLIGRDGLIRSISRPAEALFSFDSDEVTGKPFASLFAIESQRAASDYLASLSEPGVASVLNDGREVIGREAQGRFIPLFMTVGRLPGDSGYCAVVRDITQWKRAEEDLTQARAVAERASSQKTDFLARISHEIRTPLNAIIGFSELMVDEKFGPVANDRYRDYLRDINRSGNHVLDLVNDLLDISKIEAGQQEMDYEAVSLNDALAEAVALMQPQANRERVIIRSSLASRLPEVVADLRSIRQIALNILSNAIRYTQAGGQVIVSTAYESSGDVVMRVRDTGVGMTQAEIEQALKPFKQLNALKRGRGDGTGLGLPLTKAMVEANRAQFTIHSTPGEGTLVEIAFPSTRVLAE